MQSKWLGRIGLAALVLGVMGGSGATMGCVAERDPINRVQLNAIPKSFFLGAKYSDPADDPEFYARTMVIDVPYGESSSDFLMFTNTVNSTSKIKWSVEGTSGDYLVGRVSFERIEGTDGKGPTPTQATDRDPSKPLAQNDGIVVYQFRIKSHFDIRRSYNPTTGEESNVIEENTTDRPWTDRDYIRVDFSENLVTTAYDFDTLSLLGLYNGIQYTSAPLFAENPQDANAPVVDTENGYIDVTNKVFAQPKMLDFGGGFSMPGCMLPNLVRGGTQPTGNCNPNELTLRHSFKRVVPTDYEPVDWDGQKFEAYGAFTTERHGYARDYGLADANLRRYISRYNIWERHHAYKDAEKMEGPTTCKVDNDCADVGSIRGASHCDAYYGKCTLPYSDRKEKPVVWHYSDGSPPEYFEATREASEEWDAAMRVAVKAARYAECQRFVGGDCGNIPSGNYAQEEDTLYLVKEVNACRRGEVPGQDPKTCDDFADQVAQARGYAPVVAEIAKAKPMVILCHSPVADNDAKECGTKGTVARLGDLRYHLVTSIATPQTNSPWGIMTDSNDPTTGERVSASINVWTHVNDLWSRGLVDTLRYISGELKTQDVTDGTYIDQWAEAAKTVHGSGMPMLMNQQEVDKRVAAIAGTTPDKMHAAAAQLSRLNGTGGKLGSATRINDARAKLNGLMAQVSKTYAAADAPSVNQPIYEARRQMVKGTDIEAALITPAMQELAKSGYGDIAALGGSNNLLAAASVFQGMNPALRRQFERQHELSLAARGACIMNFEATAPLGYIGIGDVLQQKFGRMDPHSSTEQQTERANRMKDYLRRRVHYAVLSHEMGHSFGLRHNFVSSTDAWNFRPQYWQLRTNDKRATETCKDGADGKSCVGPRWLDPVTPNEAKNLIHMWGQSSTMEYAGEPTQDLLGLGVYDFAAARMFYGQVATVYTDKRFSKSADVGSMALDHQADFGGILGIRYGSFSSPTHYSQLDKVANLIESCKAVPNVQAFRPANWNDDKDGQWSPLLDAHLVSNEDNKTTRCSMPAVDYVQWDELQDTEGSSGTKAHAATTAKKGSRVRVPHGFASDDWADLGNVAVFRHDNGVDLYEQMHFWIAQQEMNHIFTSYRRGREDFSVWGAFNRTLSRYLEKMRDSAKGVALLFTQYRDMVARGEMGSETDPASTVASVIDQASLQDNVIAASIAFDFFSHVFSRPQPGPHVGTDVLRVPSPGDNARAVLTVPNGVAGGFGTISLGGRPIENALAENKGRDYNRDYTLNVGSYYEKAFTSYLLTESADNFISARPDDFIDPRFRAISLADVFPDGFRRWLANNLTDDVTIKGVYARTTGAGTGPQPAPDADSQGYALLGTTSWWPTQGIETCFPSGERLTCRDPFASTPAPLGTAAGPVIDPQVGWEQQKFAMIMSLLHITENQRTNWTDQMKIWVSGEDSDPGFDNRIEYHDPSGRVFIAQTFGTETLFGKTVQKGIAARVLEYANELLQKSVDTKPIVRNGVTIGYQPVIGTNGLPAYKQAGAPIAACENGADCTHLKAYTSLPSLMHDAMIRFGHMHSGGLKGVY